MTEKQTRRINAQLLIEWTALPVNNRQGEPLTPLYVRFSYTAVR